MPITGIIMMSVSTDMYHHCGCEAVNLRYADPATINISGWQAGADEDTLVVPRAGEYLYRLMPN